MFLEAHTLLEDLGEAYKSAGDQRNLEVLSYVAFFSGYGAMQHAWEEADVDNLEDEETIDLAMRAINAAGRLHALAAGLNVGEHDEVDKAGGGQGGVQRKAAIQQKIAERWHNWQNAS